MNLSPSYQAEDADPFLMPRGRLCKEKPNNILYSRAGRLACQRPRGLWTQRAIEGKPQRLALSPTAWSEDKRHRAQEEGCLHEAAAGKFCQSSCRREVVKTPRKIKHGGVGRRWKIRRPQRHSGSFSRRWQPRSVIVWSRRAWRTGSSFLFCFFKKGFVSEGRTFVLNESRLPNEKPLVLK